MDILKILVKSNIFKKVVDCGLELCLIHLFIPPQPLTRV